MIEELWERYKAVQTAAMKIGHGQMTVSKSLELDKLEFQLDRLVEEAQRLLDEPRGDK